MEKEESVLVRAHLPCDDCGSSDAKCSYSDLHTYCFSCSAHHFTEGREVTRMQQPKDFTPIYGKVMALKKRGLTEDTCRKWDYKLGEQFGEPVQVASYYKDGALVGQKVRTKDKDFKWIGGNRPGLFGQHLWNKSSAKIIVVTEGEIDAMTVSQVGDHKWPVVSVPHGAKSAAKAFKDELEYLESFETVVIMFDSDEPGRTAAQECAAILTPGKCKIATLNAKDPNELLVSGRGQEITRAMWNAEEWRPSGIVNGSELWEEVQPDVKMGLSYPFKTLTTSMYGCRAGEVIVLGAGTGLGKTTVFKEIAYHFAMEHKQRVGLIFLEEQNNMTALSMMSLAAGKPLHLPGTTISEEDKREYFDKVFGKEQFYLFNHFGSTSFKEIKSRIRYLVVSKQVKFIFLDHLAALTTGDVKLDERREIDFIMTELASMVRELKFTLFLISHLSTGSGDASHEEGGRVTIKNFRGSRAIGQWADALWALERNQQDDDETKRHTSTFRILKDRYTGQAVGTTFSLRFDQKTNRLKEVDDEGETVFGKVEMADPDNFTDF